MTAHPNHTTAPTPARSLMEVTLENAKLIEALEACSVFCTPLERLKNWNEYKEDASRKRSKYLNSP